MFYTCPKDASHQSTDSDYCSICGAKIAGAPSAAASMKTNHAVGVTPKNAPISGSETCPDCGTPRRAGARFCEVCRYNFDTNRSGSALPTAVPDQSGQSQAAPVLETQPEKQAGNVDAPSPQIPVLQPEGQKPPISLPDVDNADKSQQPAGSPKTPEPPSSQNVPPPEVHSPAAAVDAGGAAIQWEAIIRVDPALYVEPDPAVPCPINEPERVFPIDVPDNLIGRRSPRKDIFPQLPLTDPGISHRHAKILRQPDGTLALLDVGSTNGTELNGREIEAGVRTPLKDGDQITLGCWTRIIVQSRQVNR